jgi:hypothetical protein
MHNFFYKNIIITSLLLIIFSCTKEESNPVEEKTGKLKIIFSHTVGSDSLHKDLMIYLNEAGNQYEINEIKYFISDLILYPHNSNPVIINKWKVIHYVDIDIQSTLNWDVYDAIPIGNYDSVSFIFGLTQVRNQSFMFVNPPEVNMFWPEILGGGYHYMMINGKWKTSNNQIKPFNCHLGIGQIYSGTTTSTDSITGFVQNYFKVSLPTPNLQIYNLQISTLKLNMDVSSWFKTPNTYNHDIWGGEIMQKQDAMRTIKENGFDVFSVK